MVGRFEVFERIGQAALVQTLVNVIKKGTMIVAEPTGNAQATRREVGHLLQKMKGLGQDVEAFFGTDAGEIADGERTGWVGLRGLTPPAQGAVSGQVQAGIDDVD